MRSKLVPGALLLTAAALGYAAPREPDRDRWDYLVGVISTEELQSVTSSGVPVPGVGHASGFDFMGSEGWEFAGYLGRNGVDASYVLWRRRL
jgi:hypothetical protein